MTDYSISNVYPTASGSDELLAVSSTAVALTTTGWKDTTTHVLLTVGVNPIRVTFDSSAPTASNGHYWASGREVLVTKATAKAARFIRVSTDSDVHATEFMR